MKIIEPLLVKAHLSIFIIAIFISLASVAQRTDTLKVKVHDHVMTLYASGAGSPAVIMEAGLGGSHKTWDSVRYKVARFTRVIGYDRPGYLNSDTCSSSRDAITVAKELKEALAKAGINPPYVLAGLSLGGAFVRVFAGLYPKDVAGLVLVDPAPEESYARFEQEQPEIWKEAEKYLAEVKNSNRIGEREEMRYFESSMNQARRSDQYHSTPTTLLIAAGKASGGQDRDPSNPLNKIWIEELEKWAKKRPNLKYEIIRNSGHNIAKFQPDTVVHAVRYIVQQYQAKKLKQSATPYKKPLQLNDGIQTETLKNAGIDEKMIRAMNDSIVNGNYPNIHSVLILHNNKLVYENYFPGIDVTRGVGFVGFKDHHRDSLHDVRSVTKSVIGALILIAHAKGKIKSLNQRVFDFFPEYSRYDTGMKRNITVQHLLNMAAGLEWNENISYMDPSNSETRMDTARQPEEFVLSRDLIDTPGKKFNYSGGCTQVLAAIVKKTTGLAADRFAEKYLFQPMNIKDYNWVKRRDGIPIAASGLRLRSRDMAKFGLLYLNNGKWNGKQIIPSHLVAQTLKSQISLPYADSILLYVGYSNQFWIFKQNIKGELVDYVQGQGNGGQIIQLDTKNNLVLVVTAGNYNERNIRKSSFNIYPDFVYPSVTKAVTSGQSADIIKDFTYKAFDAVFKKDTVTISSLMDENFISIYPNKIHNKQQELTGIFNYMSQMEKEGHVFDSYTVDNFHVQLYDNTAVAIYYSHSKGRNKGAPFASRMQWYDVWVKRNGKWKLVASQGTSVSQ